MRKSIGGIVKELANGQTYVDAVSQNYIIIIYLFLFSLFVIANSVNIQSKYREISKAKIELQNIRSEYINSTAKLMSIKRQSKIQEQCENLNLNLKQAEKSVFIIEQ